METVKTLYQWCLLNNIRPLDITPDKEDSFMLDEISSTEFKDYLDNGDYKRSSMVRKPEKYLERRMYGLVPYNISKIQQGIQFDHAKDDYYIKFFNDEETQIFIKEFKTSIVLNGGTSNEGHIVRHGFMESNYLGTMQEHLIALNENKIKVGVFYEPDLNSMLSAIVFIVDERVFNKKSYPDFVSPPLEQKGEEVTPKELIKWTNLRDEQYEQWLEKIGGEKNEFLRLFLSDKRLA